MSSLDNKKQIKYHPVGIKAVDGSMVTNLRQAVSYFTSKMLDKDTYLAYSGKVKAVYDKMDAKYFLKEYQAFEEGNDYGNMPVRKQAETLWISDRPFAIALRHDIKNGLGIDDSEFYYVFFRKRLSFRWSSTFNNLNRYKGSGGIYLPFAVLKHIEKNKVQKITKLVLVLGDGRIFVSTYEKVTRFYFSFNMPLMINEWGVTVTPVPVNTDIWDEMI